jgi:hypothetical protein
MNRRHLSLIPAIATAALAALCLGFGSLRPTLNYDAVPYASLAKEMRGAGGKAEAFRELEAQIGNSRFQLYVSTPYRARMYRDDSFFRLNCRLYTIRPLYISLCSAVGWLIHSDISATYVVSAVATMLAVLLSFVLAGSLGVTGLMRMAVPLTWIGTGALNLASLSTPDALETLLSLLFVMVSINDTWKGMRTAGLSLLAVLMVGARTDALLFVIFLMAAEFALEPRHRWSALLVLFAALLTYLVIQRVSGNFGYIAVLNFALIEDRAHTVVPNLVPNFHGYVLALARGVVLVLGREYYSALFSVCVGLLAFVGLRERRLRATQAAVQNACRAQILAVGLLVYLLVRFAIFPDPDARYMMNAYVLTGILFARALHARMLPPCYHSEPNEPTPTSTIQSEKLLDTAA